MGMLLVNIFDSKIVQYLAESDGSPFVALEARDGECVIVSCSVEACGEEIVGKLSILGKVIDTFTNFKIDPPVLCKTPEVVFVDELFRDVGEADMCIFTTIKRSAQVKVSYVKSEKIGASLQCNTVDEEFHKYQGTRGSANIARVANSVASNKCRCGWDPISVVGLCKPLWCM